MKSLITILILLSFNLYANEEKIREYAYLNTIDDILGCSAYYLIVAEGLERKNDSSYEKVRNLSRVLILMAAHLGKDINIKQGVIDSKLFAQRDYQIKIIDGNFANLTLLNDEYKDRCIEWYDDNFQARIFYWAEKYPNS